MILQVADDNCRITCWRKERLEELKMKADQDAHRIARVQTVWAEPLPEEVAKQWAMYPISHPVVRAAMNRRTTGDVHRDAYHQLKTQMGEWGFALPLTRVASLCCGTGSLERRLVEMGLIQRCVGYDLATSALDAARQEAERHNFQGLSYEQRDLEHDGLSLSDLDLVVAHQSVHHLERLEQVFDAVDRALAPGGIVHLHEFVGPDRFQWSDRQIEEMTAWLQSLPERYQQTSTGILKTRMWRATIQEMMAHDPSEAARSSAIESVVRKRFEIMDRRELGGTLAVMALAEIAHNFDPDSTEDVAHLERLLDREAQLIAAGELTSDFVVITARKRQRGAAARLRRTLKRVFRRGGVSANASKPLTSRPLRNAVKQWKVHTSTKPAVKHAGAKALVPYAAARLLSK